MTSLPIPAEVARLLRKALLAELSNSAEALSQLAAPEHVADVRLYHQTEWRVDGTRAVLAQIGLEAPPAMESEGSLCVDEYAGLVHKLLVGRCRLLAQEAEDAEHDDDGASSAKPPQVLEWFTRQLGQAIEAQRSSSVLREPGPGNLSRE
jgi:hypothetical protein